MEAEFGFELDAFGVAEVVGVDGEALEADDEGLEFKELLLEGGGAFTVIGGAEGGGLTRGPFDEVGEADAVVREGMVVFH